MSEITQKHQNICPSCSTELSDEAKFCPSCGNSLGADTQTPATVQKGALASKLKQLTPTREKLGYTKLFIKNNFELVHTLYGLLFIIALFSAKRGFESLLLLVIVGYILSVLSNGEEIQANKKLISLFAKTYTQSGIALKNLQSESTKLVGQSSKIVGDLAKSVTNEHEEQVAVNDEILSSLSPDSSSTLTQTTLSNRKSVSLASIFLAISCVLALYGVLGTGFFKMMSGSLYDTLGQLSPYSVYLDNANGFLNGQSSNTSDMIQYVGYALIGIPIVTLFFGLLSSKLLQVLGVLTSLVELGFFLLVGSYISEKASQILGGYSDSFMEVLFNNKDSIIGFPAYALLIGAIGMVIFSIGRLISPHIKGGRY